FRPSSLDNTVTPTPANPGALPDAFLRPILGFGDIYIAGPASTSRYDSLQVQANRRFARGLELAATYTWASSTSNNFEGTPSSGTDTGLYYQLSPRLNRSRNRLVQAHVVNFSYIVDLPRGSRLVPGRPARWALDDWEISGISTFATGQPSNIT